MHIIHSHDAISIHSNTNTFLSVPLLILTYIDTDVCIHFYCMCLMTHFPDWTSVIRNAAELVYGVCVFIIVIFP